MIVGHTSILFDYFLFFYAPNEPEGSSIEIPRGCQQSGVCSRAAEELPVFRSRGKFSLDLISQTDTLLHQYFSSVCTILKSTIAIQVQVPQSASVKG